MQPVPDPAGSTSGSIESRLKYIEEKLNITPPKNRTYDGFDRTNETTVPIRRRNNTNNNNADEFQAPTPGRTREPDNEPFQENPPSGSTSRDTFKANKDGNLGAPGPAPSPPEETAIPTKKPAQGGVDDNQKGEKKDQTLKLDTRVTSRAVSPRERQSISVGFAKSVVAKSKPVNVAKN